MTESVPTSPSPAPPQKAPPSVPSGSRLPGFAPAGSTPGEAPADRDTQCDRRAPPHADAPVTEPPERSSLTLTGAGVPGDGAEAPVAGEKRGSAAEPTAVPAETAVAMDDADAARQGDWWRRNTATKDLAVTVGGVIIGLAGLGLSVWLLFTAQGTDDRAAPDGGRTAEVGSRLLPEEVETGPRALLSGDGQRMSIPERRDVFGVPRIADAPRRRWCQDATCQYDLPFVGSSYHAADEQYRSSAQMYVTQVIPKPTQDAGSVTASSFSESGEGGIVVDVPFINGWVCYRMAVAFGGAPGGEPIARTPWSTAACFLLDDQGYVIRGENRV